MLSSPQSSGYHLSDRVCYIVTSLQVVQIVARARALLQTLQADTERFETIEPERVVPSHKLANYDARLVELQLFCEEFSQVFVFAMPDDISLMERIEH